MASIICFKVHILHRMCCSQIKSHIFVLLYVIVYSVQVSMLIYSEWRIIQFVYFLFLPWWLRYTLKQLLHAAIIRDCSLSMDQRVMSPSERVLFCTPPRIHPCIIHWCQSFKMSTLNNVFLLSTPAPPNIN